MPLRKLWRKVFGSDEIQFQVLKSASAVELHYYNARARSAVRGSARLLPRYFSQHDELRVVSNAAAREESDSRIVSGEDGLMGKVSIVFGFLEAPSFPTPLSHIPEDLDDVAMDSLLRDPTLDAALSSCHLFRQDPYFQEGVLLKCIESKPLFPYIHYAGFQSEKEGKRLATTGLGKLARGLIHNPNAKQEIGVYDELYSIVKSGCTFETRLPVSKYTGFIAIAYKLLQQTGQDQESLEKTWLSWTGAREIYKYCPRSWNLRRITLHKCRTSLSKPLTQGFIYVLFCEFANLMLAEHIIQGFEVVERLKARNCGHVGLYKVQWTYSSDPRDLEGAGMSTSHSNQPLDGNCHSSDDEVAASGIQDKFSFPSSSSDLDFFASPTLPKTAETLH